jgi:hypothetical protein
MALAGADAMSAANAVIAAAEIKNCRIFVSLEFFQIAHAPGCLSVTWLHGVV